LIDMRKIRYFVKLPLHSLRSLVELREESATLGMRTT